MFPIPIPAFAKTIPWKLIGFCVLGTLVAGLMLALKLERSHSAKLTAQIEKCSEARRADRATYERAQAEAALQNKEQVQRIERHQEKINDEAKSKYERDLARLHAGGLRNGIIAAPQGSAKGDGASPAAGPAVGADAENVCVPRSLLMRAGEIELARNSLIDWLEAQLAVPRN